jgi:ABC-type Fe3+/spermidine/putrescine transport system ATPase subunit
VSLDVAEGEFVCFLGPSGCGKTTLLRIVAGLETPDAGEALLRGSPLLGVAARSRNFGMVFQSYSLFPNMTAARNVAYGLECQRRPRAEIDRRVREMLTLVHLEHEANRHPHQLSGGQQQRVALARALVNKPKLVLADEPTGNLDSELSDEVLGVLRRFNLAEQQTFILVTHDADVAAACDRTIRMRDGRIREPTEATTAGTATERAPASELAGAAR